MLRADMSNPQRIDEMWNRAREIARAIVGEPRIAITGFSMGGFAAFRLAGQPEVRAIVTMDAATAGQPPKALAATVSGLPTPLWAFFTEYGPNSGFHNIGTMNAAIAVADVPFGAVPQQDRCKTMIATQGADDRKHVRVCNDVCRSEAVYRWLLRYF